MDELNQVLFKYVLLKEACGSDNLLVDMKTFCGMTLPSIPKVECSNVVYLSVVDLHADTPEAMKKVVAKLHEEYMVGVNVNYLVLVGDQKTYVRINELKDEYGNALDWLIPFIGDWHLLSNYQSVLMKVYYDAGLKELAEASGHRGETLTSIKNSSSFKRTHQFLVQAWEAVYRQMFKSFNSCACDDDSLSISDILSAAKANMLACNQMSTDKTSSDLLKEFLERRKEIHSKLFKVFNSWVDKCADEDPNWKFWTKFVFRDMLSYLSLYVSMRGGLWKLRMGGIKTLAPLFAAFDRPHYQKLLPNHLRDLAKMPTDVISFFKSGSFVCSLTGGHMHSVALDEAHEMLINKDLKTTIVRPTKEYLDRMLYYYPVRSMLQKAVKNEVLLKVGKSHGSRVSVFDNSPNSIKKEDNVKSMVAKIDTAESLAIPANSGQPTRCLKSISGQVATPEQQVDLLGFWEIGKTRHENQIKFFVLRDPSTPAPRRKARLLTFASIRKQTRKTKRLDKEKKNWWVSVFVEHLHGMLSTVQISNV